MMLQEFKRMPGPLQKNTLIRLGLGAVFLIVTIALVIAACDAYLWLPCAGTAIFFITAAFLLFRKAVLGEYVIVTGECAGIGKTALKRRVKYIILQTEAGKVKVMLHGRVRGISAGTMVKLYLANNTLIYEQNGSQMVYSYLAIDFVK